MEDDRVQIIAMIQESTIWRVYIFRSAMTSKPLIADGNNVDCFITMGPVMRWDILGMCLICKKFDVKEAAKMCQCTTGSDHLQNSTSCGVPSADEAATGLWTPKAY